MTKKNLVTIFSQLIITLVGIGVFVFLLWEPWVEGVNANATTFSDIYFDDPFLAYVYIASIAFFIALYKAFKVLGYVRQGNSLSEETMKALRVIKYCGTTLVVLIVGAEASLFIIRPGDDIAGGVFMGLIAIVISGMIVSIASRFEKSLNSNG